MLREILMEKEKHLISDQSLSHDASISCDHRQSSDTWLSLNNQLLDTHVR